MAATDPRALNRPVPVTAANRPRPIVAQPGTVAAAEVPLEEEAAPDPIQEIAKKSPPWLVSLVVHLVIFLAMLLVATGTHLINERGIEATFVEPDPDEWSEKLGDQNEVVTELETLDPKKQMVLSESPLPPVVDPMAAPPDHQIIDENATPSATSKETAPDVGMLLKGRHRGRRGDMLAAYGGNRLTEEAVLAALEWLARNQKKDGSWSLTGPYTDAAREENIIAATAMGLLAFQGHGDTHVTPREGNYKTREEYERALRFSKIVAEGWKAMLKFFEKDGSFRNDCGDHQRLYAQGQAMIALCEVYGMTEDERFKELAQRSVDYAVRIQDKAGGWRYTPGDDSDTSVTGWFVMGLQSARMGQLNVPQQTLDNVAKFLDSVGIAEGRQYRYRTGGHTNPAMTAEGLLCRQYLGWKRDDARLAAGTEFVLGNPMVWQAGKRNVYYWYYAAQLTHHMEGEPWRRWNNVMKQMLPTHQVREGPERGSWSPAGDEWGEVAGRLYMTCLSTYMLEVYYRHLPIYRQLR